MADQIVSGLSNISLLILAARVGTPAEFGVLGASFVALTMLLSVSRLGLGNAVAMSGGGGDESVRAMAAHAAGLILCLAPAQAAFVAAVAWVSGGSASVGVAGLMGLAAPIVLMQDLLRFTASTLGRPKSALASDSAWLVVMATVLVVPMAEARNSLLAVLGAWLLGAVAALGILALALSTLPRVSGLAKWVKAHQRFLISSMGGSALAAAASVGRVSLIGAALGPVAVGSLASGQLLMTPLNILAALIPFAATPLIARNRGGLAARRAYSRVAISCGALGIVWWAICALIPDSYGIAVLGMAWVPARELLAPMALLSTFVLVSASALSLLLYWRLTLAYAIVSVSTALAALLGALVVLLFGGQVQALAWTETSVMMLGSMAGWLVAFRRSPRRLV